MNPLNRLLSGSFFSHWVILEHIKISTRISVKTELLYSTVKCFKEERQRAFIRKTQETTSEKVQITARRKGCWTVLSSRQSLGRGHPSRPWVPCPASRGCWASPVLNLWTGVITASRGCSGSAIRRWRSSTYPATIWTYCPGTLQSRQIGQTEPFGQPGGAPLFRTRALIKSRVLKCIQVKINLIRSWITPFRHLIIQTFLNGKASLSWTPSRT